MAVTLAIDDLRTGETYRAVLAEAAGVLVLVLVGTGIIAASGALEAGNLPSARLVAIAFGFGLTYAAMVAATREVSGGHINPAVTLGAILTGRIGFAKGLAYMIGQTGGGIAGSFALTTLLKDEVEGNLGAVQINHATVANLGSGFSIELVLGFVLVLTMLATVIGRGRSAPLAAPAAGGLVVVVGTLLAFALTGAAMNPARALGPAWAADLWADHWIYWVGPFTGALAAAVFYEGVILGRLFNWTLGAPSESRPGGERVTATSGALPESPHAVAGKGSSDIESLG